MDILSVGRWVLLVLGAATVLVALLVIIKPPSVKRIAHPLLLFAFGGLFLGLGIFGLEFMPQYRLWLTSLTDIVGNKDSESYMAFFNKVGKQEIPPALQEIGINYVISHPVKNMDTLLSNAVAKASDNAMGEKTLKWAKDNYEGRQKEIDHLVTSKVSIASATKFTPATIQLMHDKIRDLPDQEKRRLGIDANTIKTYRGMIRKFPGTR